MESELGRCVLGMAEQEVRLAQLDLEKLAPTDTEGIREAQARAKMNRQFGEWLRELLQDGEEALRVFKQQQEAG